MYHDAFLYTWGPSLINVIIVVLRTKSNFPPKKEFYGLTVNNQSHLTPLKLSICFTCYFTLLALLWQRLLPADSSSHSAAASLPRISRGRSRWLSSSCRKPCQYINILIDSFNISNVCFWWSMADTVGQKLTWASSKVFPPNSNTHHYEQRI